jgi:hypothetical protein
MSQKFEVNTETGSPMSETPASPAPEPALVIPEKFRNSDGSLNQRLALESYAALENAQGAPKPAVGSPASAEVTPSPTPGTGDLAVGVGDASITPEDTGFQGLISKWSEVFDRTGEIPEEGFVEMEARGLSRTLVQGHVDDQMARGEAYVDSIYTAVGGKESYTKMAQWMKSSLTPSDVAAFDLAVTGQDRELSMQMVHGMAARWTAATGGEANPLVATPSMLGDSIGFKSQAEMTAAMANPLYETDEAYRAEVSKRMQATDGAGLGMGVRHITRG